jgi:hypothetical protein
MTAPAGLLLLQVAPGGHFSRSASGVRHVREAGIPAWVNADFLQPLVDGLAANASDPNNATDCELAKL